MPLARTAGPYYGHLDASPGALATAVDVIAGNAGTELILLHADKRRLRLLVNLIAQLNEKRIYHILVLGFSSETCDALRAGGRIGCATSSHQEAASSLVDHRFVAWLQRFHLLKRLIELNAVRSRPINVLALDTDMAVRTDPYASLHAALAHSTIKMVTTFDYKGGFANTNIGYIYIRNASYPGALHGLFVEFERRIDLAFGMMRKSTQGRGFITRYLWDQNLWNKVLLSDMATHAVHLPDGSDAAWMAANRKILRARRYWREGSLPTPRELQRTAPWGETTERYLSYELRGGRAEVNPPPMDGATDGYVNGVSGSGCVGSGGGCGGGGSGESIALAPAWLVSMENGLGLKGKHWLYGATPPPAVLIHYTCTTQTEAARIWPLRLFGHWHDDAVRADAASSYLPTADEAQATPASTSLASTVQTTAAASPRLLALEGGSLSHPLPSDSWAKLNLYHALLGGLASLSGRTLVAPASNCSGVMGRVHISPPRPRGARKRGVVLEPAMSSRCFWHVHHHTGVRCVLRIGHCEGLATPSDAEAAEAAMRAGGGGAPPVVTIDLTARADQPVGAAASIVDELARHSTQRLVLLRVKLPPKLPLKNEVNALVEPTLRVAMRSFRKRCADLTSGPACNNICS